MPGRPWWKAALWKPLRQSVREDEAVQLMLTAVQGGKEGVCLPTLMMSPLLNKLQCCHRAFQLLLRLPPMCRGHKQHRPSVPLPVVQFVEECAVKQVPVVVGFSQNR